MTMGRWHMAHNAQQKTVSTLSTDIKHLHVDTHPLKNTGMMIRSLVRGSLKRKRTLLGNVFCARGIYSAYDCPQQLACFDTVLLKRNLDRRYSSSVSNRFQKDLSSEVQVYSSLERFSTDSSRSLLETVQEWFETRKRKPKDESSSLTPQAMMKWIDQTATSRKDRDLPLSQVYSIILDGALIMDSKDPSIRAKFCESVLRRIISHHRDDETDSVNVTHAFHKVMKTYCDARDIPSAERLLHELERLANTTTRPTARPTQESYTLVLAAWAKRGAPREAESVLSWMQSRGFQPSQANLDSCLNAWIKSGDSQAGPRSELLVLKMQEKILGQNEKDESGFFIQKSFGKVLDAWRSSRRNDAAERSEHILRLMQELDQSNTTTDSTKMTIDSYTTVMRTWSLSGAKQAPEKIGALLDDLVARVGLASLSAKDAKHLYANLLTAWAKSGRQDAPDRATAILEELQEKNATGDLSITLDTSLYNTVLHVYAKAGDGPRAEHVLRILLEEYLKGNQSHRPDINTFNSVLLAWSKSLDRGLAAERAESVFRRLQALERQGEVRLNIVSYNALLAALSGTSNVETARRGQVYLRQAEDRFANGDASCKPTAVTYTKAILLWTHVNTPEAFAQAQALLDKMLSRDKDASCRPSSATWRAFLSILQHNSHVPDRQERILQAQLAMEQLGRRKR